MECLFKSVDEYVNDGELIVEALGEALRLDHSLYDMLYFVLARRTSSPLVTCDKRLSRLCKDNGVECVELIDLYL